MKTIRHFFLLSLTVVLFAGCKYDDDDLWDEVNKQAERIAALEQWQTTVNGQITSLQGLITALEGNDYVTGVTAFTTPAPGGYRITFTKSPEVTIWNGAKGDTGAAGHSPAIGVKQFPDDSGVYYWTLDGEFITDNGNKIPVTGENGTTPTITIGANGNWVINGTDTGVKATGNDGVTPTVIIGANGNWIINGVDTGKKAQGNNGATPKVIIGADDYWYISADGTATGTAPGTGWTDTGVKATGPQGDAIFAANGVDNSNDDYVVFTLDSGGTITLPRYKAFSFKVDKVTKTFTAGGQTIEINCEVEASANVEYEFINFPVGWGVYKSASSNVFRITSAATLSAADFRGDPIIIATDGSLSLTRKLMINFVDSNTPGGVYYRNGNAIGLVYVANNGQGTGRVVTLDEANVAYGYFTGTAGATSETDGISNVNTLYEHGGGKFSNSFHNCPAIQYMVAPKNPDGTVYVSGMIDTWYLPAKNELLALYAAWNGGPGASEVNGQRTIFNGWLTGAGGTSISTAPYWSSTEGNSDIAWLVNFADGTQFSLLKGSERRVRAVLAF